MKHYKHNKAISSLLAFSLLALSACGTTDSGTSGSAGESGAQSSGNSNKTVLTLWHYYNGSTKDALDVIISEFNDTVGAEQNIAVDAYSYSSVSDLASALVASANKEVGMADLPDIYSAYSDTALLLDNMGLVADMDQYFSEAELALFQKDFLKEGRFEDEEASLKIIPVAKSTELLFLNDTDFQVFAAETGASMDDMATWEGLAQTAESYYNWTDAQTDAPNDGSALFGVDSEANFLLVAARQLGEEMYLYEEDAVLFGLSESAARRIWDTVMVPYVKGHYTSLGSYRSDDVKSGDLLIYAGSTSSVYYFPTTVELGREEAYDIEGLSMPYPYFEGGEKVAVQQGAGMVVSKSNETQESAAATFLKWFTSAEYNLDFAVSTGYIPVHNDALYLDGVMGVMEENAEGEIPQIVMHSTEIIYNELLPNYTFYSTKPFDGSYDTRNAVANSFIDVLDVAYDAMSTFEESEDGPTREEFVAQLTGEDAFQTWYQLLKHSVEEILTK